MRPRPAALDISYCFRCLHQILCLRTSSASLRPAAPGNQLSRAAYAFATCAAAARRPMLTHTPRAARRGVHGRYTGPGESHLQGFQQNSLKVAHARVSAYTKAAPRAAACTARYTGPGKLRLQGLQDSLKQESWTRLRMRSCWAFACASTSITWKERASSALVHGGPVYYCALDHTGPIDQEALNKLNRWAGIICVTWSVNCRPCNSPGYVRRAAGAVAHDLDARPKAPSHSSIVAIRARPLMESMEPYRKLPHRL